MLLEKLVQKNIITQAQLDEGRAKGFSDIQLLEKLVSKNVITQAQLDEGLARFQGITNTTPQAAEDLKRQSIQSEFGQGPIDLASTDLPFPTDSARAGIEQGISLGFVDEIKAGLGAIVESGGIFTKDFGDAYERRASEIRRKYSLLEKTNPGNYLAGQVFGGVVAPGGLGASMALKGGRAFTANAGMGALEGLGYGEEDKLQSGALGGLIGGAVPVLGAATNLVGKGLKGLSKKAVPELQDEVIAADKKLLKSEKDLDRAEEFLINPVFRQNLESANAKMMTLDPELNAVSPKMKEFKNQFQQEQKILDGLQNKIDTRIQENEKLGLKPSEDGILEQLEIAKTNQEKVVQDKSLTLDLMSQTPEEVRLTPGEKSALEMEKRVYKDADKFYKAQESASKILSETLNKTEEKIQNSIANSGTLLSAGAGALAGFTIAGVPGLAASLVTGLIAKGVAPGLAKSVVNSPKIQGYLTRAANAKGDQAQVLIKEVEALITQELTRAGAQ